jgi:HK97 gp10 family phage protein
MSRRQPNRGMNELERLLRRAPEKVLGETEKSLLKAAGTVKRAAQALAPESAGMSLRERKALAGSLGVKTSQVARGGRLKRNILVKRSRGYSRGEPIDRDTARAVAVYVRFSRQRGRYDPKNAWYAHFVEWGTSKMTARPFLTPAWQAREQEVERIVTDQARQAVERLRMGAT